MTAVDAIVLTYRPELALRRCIDSLAGYAQVNVVVAVNNDSRGAATAQTVLGEGLLPHGATLLHLGRNWGFAEGINRAVAETSSPLILLLNDDAWLTSGALEEMVFALEQAPAETAGVVPKILLGDSDLIDAVGARVGVDGSVSNRGFGRQDVGEFDTPGPVEGACFAAVLLRRRALEEVGPLWSPYFMYAEDADWCLRARLAGWRFLTCPTAIVRHEHSASASTHPESWKAFYIRRNSMLMVLRCFPPRHALGLTCLHLCQAIGGKWADCGNRLRMTASFARHVPRALATRRGIRGVLGPHSLDAQIFGPSPIWRHKARIRLQRRLARRREAM